MRCGGGGGGGGGGGRRRGRRQGGGGGGEGERSAFQVYREIERVIAERVRPVLQRDGGDIELVDIKGWRVYCSLKGRCASCLGASRTLQLIVERSLKDGVDERIRVIPV